MISTTAPAPIVPTSLEDLERATGKHYLKTIRQQDVIIRDLMKKSGGSGTQVK